MNVNANANVRVIVNVHVKRNDQTIADIEFNPKTHNRNCILIQMKTLQILTYQTPYPLCHAPML